MFDEEIELEGREDYEADYEKVLDGLEYPGDYFNRDKADARIHPAIRGIMLDNPMSQQEFSFSGSHLLLKIPKIMKNAEKAEKDDNEKEHLHAQQTIGVEGNIQVKRGTAPQIYSELTPN